MERVASSISDERSKEEESSRARTIASQSYSIVRTKSGKSLLFTYSKGAYSNSV